MKKTTRIWTSILSALAMLILILDARTALKGAKEGVTLCLYTVIPSLFPFLIFSCLINSATTGLKISILTPISKLCGIPAGSESLLLLGLIGGYPVGAQSIYYAYKNEALTQQDAHRMLGFCSNAGPAFIFGMMSSLFAQKRAILMLWIIHVLSAIIVGIMLPNKSRYKCKMNYGQRISIVSSLEISIKIMANICGWVILFRVIISFLSYWILWILPQPLQSFVVGILELSNGCISLYHIASSGIRFILASVILSFGGICVYMQTKSVTKELGIGKYFPGKIMQSIVSFMLSCVIQQWIFAPDEALKFSQNFNFIIPLLLIVPVFLIYRKNNSRNLNINSI